MLGVITALLGVIYKEPIGDLWFEYTTVRRYIAENVKPHVLTPEAEHSKKPGDVFRECAGDCPEIVVIPAGSFRMGSPDSEPGRSEDEGPVRTVTIAKPIAVSKFEVTWGEYAVCVAMRGCPKPFGDSGFGKGRKPVINVSWEDAKAYAAWFSRMTEQPYRLLTEVEWEYAARGATSATASHPTYPWGDQEICQHANLADQSFRRRGYTGDITDCDDRHQQTAEVGAYPANPFGLHDMHGNVWEWCEDNWHPNYQGAPTDGSVWQGGDASLRVVRGGSWNIDPEVLRSAFRLRYRPGDRNYLIGFRIARTLK